MWIGRFIRSSEREEKRGQVFSASRLKTRALGRGILKGGMEAAVDGSHPHAEAGFVRSDEL